MSAVPLACETANSRADRTADTRPDNSQGEGIS